MIPEPWEFTLLAVAAFRIWKLIGDDTILDRPRAWAIARRDTLELFLACPYCLGWWTSLGLWLAWLVFADWALLAATPWAISGVVGLIGARAHPVEE